MYSPCVKCKHGGICGYNHGCSEWQEWFKKMWRGIRIAAGKEKHGQ